MLNKMKILVLPYTHTLSHLSRALEISKHLSKAGYVVEFGGNSSKTKFIKDEGFIVHNLFEPDPETLFNKIRSKQIKFVDDQTLQTMIQSDQELFKLTKPDLILSDGRFSAMISSQLSGIKHIAIVNGSSTEFRSVPYFPFMKALDINIVADKNIIKKMMAKINLDIEIFVFDNTMNIFKKITKNNKLHTPVTATNCLCGVDVTLIADIPEFFPTRNLPPNYKYIGPITWKSNVKRPLPEWWPIKKNNRKLIYLTMGTTGDSGLFAAIYNQIKKSDLLCIITTGNQSKSIVPIPGSIYVTDFMDGDLIMDECDMVICHGGNGTIYQALSHGVPVIGIPTIPDQEFNMRRVETLGLGKKIAMSEILSNPAVITKTILEIDFCKNINKSAILKTKADLLKLDGARLGFEKIVDFLS